MSKNGTNLLQLIFRWWSIADKARAARQLPPEKRRKVVRFGVLAVIYAIVTAACACALLLFKVGFDSGLVIGLFALIFAVGIGVFGTLISFITTLVYWFSQLSINRRAGTWVTFLLVLVVFAVAVAVPLIYFA